MPLPLLALLAVVSSQTPAAPASSDVAAQQENYEESLVAWALKEQDRVAEPEPEGKVLEEVLVSTEEVVAESDPYPDFLNIFHVRTREEVVRREVLLQAGQPYSTALADETARNLRSLRLFSVVRLVPVKGRAPGTVALLVVTKDLWSLRLNSDFAAVGSLLQYLRLQGTEQNFLGRGKKLAVDFTLRLDTVSLGQSYTDPRVLGSRWSLSESAALIIGRESGQAEGSRGSLSVSRPLYSLSTPWSTSTSVAWNVETNRVYRGADIWQLPFPDGPAVPYVYETEEVAGGVSYTRSYGLRYKWNVGGTLGAYHYAYDPPAASMLSDAQLDWFRRNYLPRAEDAGYASLSLRAFEARYEVMRDVDSYALSEDFQIGHSVSATVRYAPPIFGSASHFAELGVAARYRLRLGDSLTTASAAAAIRRQLGEGAEWNNRRWATELAQVSPKVLGGRFVARGLLDVNIDDLFDRITLLGGGNGLRGARVDAYSGKRLLLFNVEYRTAPLVVRTVHLGGVLFFDSGSAFDDRPDMVHTVGVGVRLLFPQFNVLPFRLDFGYVLNDARPPVGSRFSIAGGQLTDLRPGFLDSPL
ncbi:BamA/TamA family outer membrane protein [Pyxidicoccus sp. MSG2]|uniref:BamA/TamA family outer membrane protein n=1 Tax=Pyxidicoccus sp. MSG2 TaxID=2996790 RepID=UPI00226F92B7|nr:BamA/TamA family outer membrane protein [Pyxidicoccus sp. MSG2]MCY1020349.1 BamA/TamA family outer membrane protein [Pyxidicoccus sp. MSG2]